MVARAALLIAAMTLGACHADTAAPAASPVEQSPDRPPSVSSTQAALQQIADLRGEYRLAAVEGRPLASEFGIAVSIEGAVLSFEPTCAGFVWRLAFSGARLITERPGQVATPGAATAPVCAVAIHPEQRRLAAALDAVERAERTANNGILLSGQGRSVTLFLQ